MGRVFLNLPGRVEAYGFLVQAALDGVLTREDEANLGALIHALKDAGKGKDGCPPVVLDPHDLALLGDSAPGYLRDGARLCDDAGQHLSKLVLTAVADQLVPPKPDEPTAFGAKVTARAGGLGSQRFIRAPGRDVSKPWMSEGRDHYSWREMHDISLGWVGGAS